MSKWFGNPTNKYVIRASDEEVLPDGFIELADETARDNWLSKLYGEEMVFVDEDYTRELNARIDAVARQMDYKHIESMKGYCGYENDWREECLPFAQWDARVWKLVGQIARQPRTGPMPHPKDFADYIFSVLPPPPIVHIP